MPSLSQMSKANYLAKVDSGRIRYFGLPTAAVVVVDGTPGVVSQLFTAAGAPQVDYWLCGFQAATFMAGAGTDTVVYRICLGYGGLDGAAVIYTTLLLTTYPVAVVAIANAVGMNYVHTQWLPYPIRIPGGNRMAVRIDDTLTGADNIDEFRVILATVVGQGA